MLYRMCALVVISGITGGLAYPLLKIWMIDWQAKIRICWAIWMTFL